MNKKLKNKVIGLIMSLSIIMIAIALDSIGIINLNEYLKTNYNLTKNNINKPSNLESYEVIRVVDGDTFCIKYNGKDEKVRLIGVDAPESVHPDKEKNTEFGKEVSDYSKEMLTGKQVELEFDVQKEDKYGRLLAYVYLSGQMYNQILLEKGYAQVSTYPPNVKYVDVFTKIQKQARENKVGMWKY